MNIKVNSQKVKEDNDKFYYLENKNKIYIDELELLLKFHKLHKNVNYIIDLKVKKEEPQDGGDMKVINLNGSNSQNGGG